MVRRPGEEARRLGGGGWLRLYGCLKDERSEGDHACGDEDCRLLCLNLWNQKILFAFDLLSFGRG